MREITKDVPSIISFSLVGAFVSMLLVVATKLDPRMVGHNVVLIFLEDFVIAFFGLGLLSLFWKIDQELNFNGDDVAAFVCLPELWKIITTAIIAFPLSILIDCWRLGHKLPLCDDSTEFIRMAIIFVTVRLALFFCESITNLVKKQPQKPGGD